MKPLMLLGVAATLLLSVHPAGAEVRALLVGVSDYQYLDADLRGPANDVRLMAETLAARGADTITVLAAPSVVLPKGVRAGGAPTHAAIVEALGKLADGLGPGDTALFYFSGHGAQAPDTSGDEAGGYDEILLPADSKQWNGGIGEVENSIVDDAFGPYFQAILDSGATLVAIVDACHSATGFRAVGGTGVARFLGPEILHLPADAPPPPAADPRQTPPLSGEYAFLYSSQSDERSFEFPLGDPDQPGNWYGGFTRALARALADAPALTWEQALAAATDALRRDGVDQTPDGEGTALESPVFGAARVSDVPARIPFRDGVLSAGLLDDLSEGAVVALYASAAAPEPVGEAQLTALTATSAQLSAAPELPASGFAMPIAPGLPVPFAIAPPVVLDDADYAPILDQLAELSAAGLPEGAVWNAASPDAVPVLVGGALALTGPDGVLDPAGPGSSPRMRGDPADFFERAARVHNLRRALALAQKRPGRRTAFPGAGLNVTVERQPGSPSAEGCGEPAPPAAFDAAQPVGPCDRLWLSMANRGTAAQDVTVLYVDADNRISALWPEPGLSNRIGFGETREAGLEIHLPDNRPGREEIVVIAVPARPGAPRTVLTALADPAVTRAGPDAPLLEQYLRAALEPGSHGRAFGATGDLGQLGVTRVPLVLSPGPE
ncbi:caspase family protein [Oceaniglobus roseus]|uniref:caspase family protein n=1 Tax=Oceaniglobus roseus TaxID=1737570 RepID=UPI000C7F7532|nr:caspase family protein [Kandeliimicrobium roseum]